MAHHLCRSVKLAQTEKTSASTEASFFATTKPPQPASYLYFQVSLFSSTFYSYRLPANL